MSQTTQCKRRETMKKAELNGCHQGTGITDFTGVILPGDLHEKHLRFMHDDRLRPGATIGMHRHESDEEYYYFLAGTGTMILDGERLPVRAGDVTAVFPGGSHGLINDGDIDLRFIVVSVA